MRRRVFLGALGYGAASPFMASAQQSARVCRIAVMHDYGEHDPEGHVQIDAFRDELSKLGWVEGRNAILDLQSGNIEADLLGTHVRDLLAKRPDVVVAAGATIVAALQRASRTVPIVFVTVTDPVGSGLVNSLGRPGGNTTGFTQFEFGISAKWLELLKEMAPRMNRVAVIRDPAARSGGGQLGAIQAVAPSLKVDVRPIDATDPDAIERDLRILGLEPNGGLIVTSSRLARTHRELIVGLAARHRLPAIYAFRAYVASGGLMSFGPDAVAPYRRAAGYIDRILKGEKPADLPVQAPIKYELVINMAAAKGLEIAMPPSLIAQADEIIE